MSENGIKAMASDIPVYCAHDKIVDITELVPNPRNPNKHPDVQIGLLSKIIRNNGWRQPIKISKRSGFIVSGHGRLEAAKLLGVEKVPVDYQEYVNEAQEWQDLIADNRLTELSEMDNQMLKDLLQEIDDGQNDMDFTGYTEAALEDLMTQFHTDEEKEEYTKKINIPCYEIKGEKPSFIELVETEKAVTLENEIKALNLNEEEKQFLLNAAQRLLKFNYEKIAEYYAHAKPEVQAIMEKMALVLIDYDKAIENGFAVLQADILNLKQEDTYAE